MFYNSHSRRVFSGFHFFISILTAVCLVIGAVAVVRASTSPISAHQSTITIYATVKRPSVNLRQGPGFQYDVLGRMRKNGVMPVVGQFTNSNGEVWYEVYIEAFGNVWVASWVVELDTIVSNVPASTFSTGGALASSVEIIVVTANAPISSPNSGAPNAPATTPDP